MAKIFGCILCIFFIYGCHNRRVPEAGVTKLDSAKADIPVQVDTSFADTATAAITDTVVIDTVLIKKDTVKVKVVEEKKMPSLQSIYTSFIGVREKTGNNDGPEVEMFLRTVGLGKGYAWCAAFVKYCLLKSGVKRAEKINGMALSCENKNDMVWKNGKRLKDLKAGDVFTLYYAKLGRIGHTGFYNKIINSSIFETVEGNTNDALSRDGDGVYRKKRSFNATWSISRWE